MFKSSLFVLFICLCMFPRYLSQQPGNDHPLGLHHHHEHHHVEKRRTEWHKRFGKDALGMADSSMKESELYSLLLILKSISFMVESHLPWGKPDSFPPGHSVFENQGHIYDVFEQVRYYSALARVRPNISTICEIGYNAGHSATTFLYSNPNITFISFDLMVNPWSWMTYNLTKDLFGDRFKMIIGSSAETLDPKYMDGRVCDIVSVDGDHHNALRDFRMARSVSRPGTLVVADDYGSANRQIVKDVNTAVHGDKILKEVELLKDFRWIPFPGEYFKGWALLEYV